MSTLVHTALCLLGHTATHRSDLEGIVGSSVVDVMAETRHEECQHFNVLQQVQSGTALEQSVAVVGDGEGVEPVVIGRVSVPLFNSEDKPVWMIVITSESAPRKFPPSNTNQPKVYLARVFFSSLHFVIRSISFIMLITACTHQTVSVYAYTLSYMVEGHCSHSKNH